MTTEERESKSADWRRDNLGKNAVSSSVVGSVIRPKNGHELLQALREYRKCEVVDTHAFIAAKALEDNECGFSFSFKLSQWTKGWAGFQRT